jgi:hypothetical protein
VFESPDRTVSLSFSMVGFVDDSTGTVNWFDNNDATIEELLARLQKDAQLWHDLLWCSGGMLEISKCSYHFVYFEFDAAGNPHPIPGTVGPPLKVLSPTGQSILIPPKSVYMTHKTLGHLQAPAGTGRTQLHQTRSQQTLLSQQLASSPATQSQASTFYHTIYLPLIYVLPQSFFDPKDLDLAEKKSMSIIFAKEGYNRNTARDLLYGPTDYAGAGHVRWKWLQGEGQIMNFFKYWRINGQISTTLRIAVSWYQFHAGVGFSLFHDVHTPMTYSDARWLNSLRSFLATINARFDLDDTYVPHLQRIGDVYLMDLLVGTDAYPDDVLRIINNCRLFLNVITLSDITNAAGTHLIPGVKWGEHDLFPSSSNHHAPRQSSPTMFFWTYWQRLLRIIALPSGQLRNPLGPWLFPGSELRRTWNAYFDLRYKFLYRQTPTGWLQYELFDTRFINGIPRTWQPTTNSVPVTAQVLSKDCWQLEQPPAFVHHLQPVCIPVTFHDYLAQLPAWEHYLFADLQLLYDPYEIM